MTPPGISIHLRVNHSTHDLAVDPRLMLLDVLRHVLGLSDRTGRLVTTSLAEYGARPRSPIEKLLRSAARSLQPAT